MLDNESDQELQRRIAQWHSEGEENHGTAYHAKPGQAISEAVVLRGHQDE